MCPAVSCQPTDLSMLPRFAAPRKPDDSTRNSIIRDIEKKASEAWGSGKNAIVAWDFMRVHVPLNVASSGSALTNITREIETFRAESTQQGRVDSSKAPSYNHGGKWRR